MRITASRQVEGGRILSEIGRIEAASEWGGEGLTETRRAAALEKLKELAREYEADAIVGSISPSTTCRPPISRPCRAVASTRRAWR